MCYFYTLQKKMFSNLAILCLLVGVSVSKEKQIEFLMPEVQPEQDDTYLCTSIRIKGTRYITKFTPQANINITHHMTIWGCDEPGADTPTWKCHGEMQKDGSNDLDKCKRGGKLVYTWAMNATALELPEDVSFQVGEDSTGFQHLVLQVHYKSTANFKGPNADKDSSGVILTVQEEGTEKLAGVHLISTLGEIPPMSKVYMEAACGYWNGQSIFPFAYRVHSHSHGKVISGYRISPMGDKWEEIGKISPQEPQMFYNVTTPGMEIRWGDILAVRCTMVNQEDRTIKIGPTQHDEMCNFYIMYYVDDAWYMPNIATCISEGPPKWSWKDFTTDIIKSMPKNVSLLPGEEPEPEIETTLKPVTSSKHSINEAKTEDSKERKTGAKKNNSNQKTNNLILLICSFLIFMKITTI